jgi:dTDP-4-amino-4,6-dideoxygalactose transaminase
VNNRLKIPFSKVPICGNELKYVKEVLDSGWLTTAGKTALFEKKFAENVNAKYSCATNSCTAALHLGVEALGVKPGEKVFVQSMTFTSSAEVIRYLGAHPVFLDIEYGSNLITPTILQSAIKKYPDVKYLVIVHYGGQAAEMINENGEDILNLCHKHGIKIIEDAAHAFPCKLKGKMVGSFGDVTCFSFYANKTITSGEGGMLVTDNEDIFKRVKTMRLHGINRDVWDRYISNKPTWEYDIVEAGYKYNMPDINAAIGLAQLEQAELFRNKRQEVAEYYFNNLRDVDSIDLPLIKVPFEDHSWHLFHIVLNENAIISRDEFIQKLSKAGIGTSVHYKPLHNMTYYREKYKLIPSDFPATEKTWHGNVSLPIYPFITKDELAYIVKTIRECLLRYQI